MTTSHSTSTQAGIPVSTAIVVGIADRLATNHAEGIIVSTAINGGASGHRPTLGETCPGCGGNHAEGIVVSTAITAGIGGGDIPGERNQHAEGIVVSTAITAGLDGVTLNHAEAVIGR